MYVNGRRYQPQLRDSEHPSERRRPLAEQKSAGVATGLWLSCWKEKDRRPIHWIQELAVKRWSGRHRIIAARIPNRCAKGDNPKMNVEKITLVQSKNPTQHLRPG